MAATLTLDHIEGSELELGPDGNRRVRTGVITGLDVDITNDPQVLEKSLLVTGMPGKGNAYPGNPQLVLQKIGIIGIACDAVRVRLEYRSLSFTGGIEVAYVLSDETALATEDTFIHPASGKPIKLGLKQNLSDNVYLKNPATVSSPVLMPMRQIGITAVLVGDPNDLNTVQNAAPSVNDTDWPAGNNPLPKGYWLMNRWKKSVARYAGYYQLEASCISRVHMDWMQYRKMIDPHTGLMVEPTNADGTPLTNFETLTQAFVTGTTYVYDVVKNEQLAIAKIGWYPLASFASVFGFG